MFTAIRRRVTGLNWWLTLVYSRGQAARDDPRRLNAAHLVSAVTFLDLGLWSDLCGFQVSLLGVELLQS